MRPTTYHLPDSPNTCLFDPPIERLPGVIKANRELLAAADLTIAGVPRSEVAARSRKRLLDVAASYGERVGANPAGSTSDIIIATGHQPGFHHPGVWIKNHLVSSLAQSIGAVGINLVQDSDTPTDFVFNVPDVSDGHAAVQHLRPLAVRGDLAVEDQHLSDPEPIEKANRIALGLIPNESAKEATNKYFESLCESARNAAHVADALTIARLKIEKAWGIRNLEVRFSDICRLESFRLLVIEMLRRPDEFASAYNRALDAYRKKYHVRGKANPLPDLVIDHSIQLPLWVWPTGTPRQTLSVSRNNGATLLHLGDTVIAEISAATLSDPQAAIEHLEALDSSGIKLRSKAIVSTIHMRLFLFDLFIHGIGGGNYDIITDEVIRDFFDIAPPTYAVATANATLPYETFQAAEEDLAELNQIISHMLHGPYNSARRLLADNPNVAHLLALRQDALLTMVNTRRKDAKAALFARIKGYDARLRNELAPHIEAKQRELEVARHHVAYNHVVTARDYPFFTYPPELLRNLYAPLQNQH